MASYALHRKSEVLEARFVRACDGDTIIALISLGLGVWIEKRVRIACIESYEMNSPQKADAELARSWLDTFLMGHIISLHPAQGGADKYGRLRAHVFRGETSVAEALIGAGKAWRVPPSHTHANPSPRGPIISQQLVTQTTETLTTPQESHA